MSLRKTYGGTDRQQGIFLDISSWLKNDLDEVSVIYSYVLSTRFGSEAATKDE